MPNAKRTTTRATTAKTRPLVSPAAVRRWAGSQDIDVNERGRIAADVLEKYLARFRSVENNTAA